MQRSNRLPFSPGYQYKATRPFVMGGVAYTYGDVIDKAGIEDRRLRLMYEARMIEVAEEAAPVARVAAVLQPPQKPAKAPEEAPVASTIEHRGFGRWYVVKGQETVSGPHTQAEAQKLIAA